MLTEQDESLIQESVSDKIIPEIKASIPSWVGWVIRIIWPKLDEKIVKLITVIVKQILERHQK